MLIDWCGQAAGAVRPVANLIRAEVMAADRLHADDTPIREMKLAGRERGVNEGRIWVYVRDDRPWGGKDPPAAAYWFSPDRKGEHPQELSRISASCRPTPTPASASFTNAGSTASPESGHAPGRVG